MTPARTQIVRRSLAAAVVPDPATRAIERRRRDLIGDQRLVNTHLPRQPERRLPLGAVVRTVTKRPVWGRFLLQLAARLRPAHALELGASVGLSASYIATGLARGGGRLVTIEGVPDIAAVAAETIELVAPRDTVELRVGTFAQRLPEVIDELGRIQLAFVDGHHERAATLAYLDAIRPALDDTAVVVFDDVAWSDGMREAWRTIRDRDDTGLAMSVGGLGIWGPLPTGPQR